MTKLIPGEPLIYERNDGVVYARYRDPPHNTIPRWVVGGDPGGVTRAQGYYLTPGEWRELCELAKENATLKTQLDKTLMIYYTIKDG